MVAGPEAVQVVCAARGRLNLGRVHRAPRANSPTAAEELVAVSSRCAEFAETITAAALYDWDSPQRLRELSASRIPMSTDVLSTTDSGISPSGDAPLPPATAAITGPPAPAGR
jgi:hypothetical protein